MSKEAVKQFMEKMNSDETFAEKIAAGKDRAERLAIAKTAGFDFTADEFNEMADNGEINIDRTLSYLAKTYESRGIRLFVRSGTGLFE
ncbi:MAG: Nif11-like leader peptide family natural product precursor [Bacillota bacterium]